jgi:hypothetical protein
MPDAFELARQGNLHTGTTDSAIAALGAQPDHVVGSKMDDDVRQRLESWLARQLDNPVGMGEGRNNQMIQLAPRMFELGWDEEAIFEKFLEVYDLAPGEKDREVWAVIRRSKKYVETQVEAFDLEALQEKRVMAEREAAKAARTLTRVLKDYTWTMDDIARDGGCIGMTPRDQKHAFLSTLFTPDDIVWCGMTWDSGKEKHRKNFRAVREWLKGPIPGEFCSHCTFKPGTISRANDFADQLKYMVVESDKLTLDQIGSVFSFLVHECECVLRAVTFSGKRSLHGWFERDQSKTRETLEAWLTGFRCDGSVVRVSQPVRLAGQFRNDTEKVQTLLYLS